MDEASKVLTFGRKMKQEAKPLLTYVILLRNGNTIQQLAEDWSESSDEDGSGIAYSFYIKRQRVLHLEFTEVRSVMCREHVDVEATLQALRPTKAPRKRKESSK
jgi:hypothetical protein